MTGRRLQVTGYVDPTDLDPAAFDARGELSTSGFGQVYALQVDDLEDVEVVPVEGGE